MTSDDYLTHDSVEGKPWDISIIDGAWYLVDNAKDDLHCASMLNEETAAAFDKLLAVLEKNIEGFKDANRS